MKKSFRLIVVVLLALSVTVLPGCLPKLKDGASFTPPSWKVPVQVPVVKKQFILSDLFAELGVPTENLKIDQNTKMYRFIQQFEPQALTVDIPDLNQAVDELSLPSVHWESAAFNVTVPPANAVRFEESIKISDLGGDSLIPTQTVELTPNTVIEIPFESIKLSNLDSNSIHFTLTTNEPFDGLTLQLVDLQGNPVGEIVDFGSVPGDTSVQNVTTTKKLHLGGKTIPHQMQFKLVLKAHSTSAYIKLDIAMNEQLQVVELIPLANDPDNPLTKSIPQIDIPEIKPLANFPKIQEIKFASGRIRFRQTKQHTPDHPFPFSIRFDQMNIDGDRSRFHQDLNGDIYLDLTNLVLTPTTTMKGADVELIANPVYDVWDDVKGIVVPYNYDLSFAFEDIEIAYIQGDSSMINDLVPDPNPATPGVWDYAIEPKVDITEISYPFPMQDFAIGLSDLFVNMNLKNNTSLQGSFTFSLKAMTDKTHPMMKDGKPLESTFTIHVSPRQDTVFELTTQAGYQALVEIINTKPPVIQYSYQGILELPETFQLTADDSLTMNASISLPLSVKVGAGGAKIPGVYKEHMTLSTEQREALKMAYEFIDEASLNIRYNNQSDLGLGGTITFTVPDGRKETVNPVIFNNQTGVAQISVNRNLLDILRNEGGFDIVCDLLIPNESSTERSMNIKASDQLDLTIWIDAKVRAHVPSQQ